MFCTECGIDHHVADRAAEAAADREVTLAKIQADRDIKIAQITSRTAAELAETENALDTARAEGVAEGMGTVIESGAGVGQADELAEPGAPIVLDSPAAEEPAPVAPDMAPPEVIETSSPRSGSGSDGWWAGYK